MTKVELEEYVEELEDAVDGAYRALAEDDPDRALGILKNYAEDEEEAQEEAPDEGVEEEDAGGEEV